LQVIRGPLDSGETSVVNEDLTKVVVDLPNHWATSGESMWAKRLGGDLYEIRNVPFYAYGLNFGDVVRAIEPAPDKKPAVLEVVRASGHRTLRVSFTKSLPPAERPDLFTSLNSLKASFEGANAIYFAIDVEPAGNYQAVCDRLAQWEAQGLLGYETCEPRSAGSFDDVPGSPS
jgi:hypothetical protein